MKSLLGIAGLTVVVLFCGCSQDPKLYPVSGTVTFDGAPVADGDILFVPVDPALGPEPGKIKDGKYTLTAREGKKRVEIRASKVLPGGAKGAGGEPVAEEFLPRKYNEDSTLSTEVNSKGVNKADFTLTGK
jgi:hypothetical protein